jgi:phosphatidate cytidylyltransferase
MKVRVVAGVIAAVLTALLVLYGPFELMFLVVVLCAAWSSLEFNRLFFSRPSTMRQALSLSLILISVSLLRWSPEWSSMLLWLPLFVLSLQHLVRANRSGDFEKSIRDLSIEFLGVVYVVCMLGFMLPIAETPQSGRELLLLLFFFVFSGDTFAYFVGTVWGRHRLAEQISPKKSLEGAAGAVVGALLFGGIWVYCFRWATLSFSLAVQVALLGVGTSVLAQLGDLFESMLKRSRAQKDSGQFLPGHGGILDRIDGLSLSAPAFYLVVRWMGSSL